ncbi:hypothetical protein [Hymenobacter sp.]|jgi:hypothetical protein|uniref:hypothetical protein n=1 Tax=Hymenobacter sp. TaxID=1898978 RepID=UPI002ED8D47E
MTTDQQLLEVHLKKALTAALSTLRKGNLAAIDSLKDFKISMSVHAPDGTMTVADLEVCNCKGKKDDVIKPRPCSQCR